MGRFFFSDRTGLKFVFSGFEHFFSNLGDGFEKIFKYKMSSNFYFKPIKSSSLLIPTIVL